MVGNNHQYNLSTTQDFDFNYTRLANPTVCAKTGVAGIGSSTDHGYEKPRVAGKHAHNHGRGGNMKLFTTANFMMQKSGYSIEEARRGRYWCMPPHYFSQSRRIFQSCHGL
jgi:hypothetical protein